MRRAVIFVTLALLLLAVAGVTIAQEGNFRSDEPAEGTTETTSSGDTLPETTALESTAPEGTVPDPAIPGPNVQETTKPEPEQPDDGEEAFEEKPLPEASVTGENGEKGGSGGEKVPDSGGEAEDEADDGRQPKVTLCHKNKVTISVGAPAQAAHLRHGDALGVCDDGSAGNEGADGSEEADEPDGRAGGPPEGKGRPDGAGKPDDAGKKPGGGPEDLDEERATGPDAAEASPGNSADKPGKAGN